MTFALGSLKQRVAKRSDDYVDEIIRRRGADGSRGLSTEAKIKKMAMVLSDEVGGIRRLGVGMIGPIQLKLRYQGIVRNVLLEDPITPGSQAIYDIMDDLGQAYMMAGSDGEVRVTPFEGKRVMVQFYRIASRPVVRKEDLYALRLNIVEQAQDLTKQAIMQQEDSQLMVILQAALASYATNPRHTITPNHTVIETSGYYSADSLYTGVALSDMHQIASGRILTSPIDYRDIYRWSINQTGWAFKDRVVAGEKVTSFGEFQIQRSIMVPVGTMWILPNPDFLGVFPVLYSLDVEESHTVEDFYRGWVFDEMVNMLILNPRGIVSVVKA